MSKNTKNLVIIIVIKKIAMPVTTEIYLIYLIYYIHLLDYVDISPFNEQ